MTLSLYNSFREWSKFSSRRSQDWLEWSSKIAQIAIATLKLAVFSQTASMNKTSKKKSSKKILIENRKTKKLMIQIIDSKKKKKLMKKSIKNFTVSLRETCEEIIEINRLVSEDIRVFIRFAEIKNDLYRINNDYCFLCSSTKAHLWCHDARRSR